MTEAFAVLIFTHTPHDSWRSSSEKRSPSQHMYISSRQMLKHVTSQMMQLQSGYSSRDKRMPRAWPPAYMRREQTCSAMHYLRSKSLMQYNN